MFLGSSMRRPLISWKYSSVLSFRKFIVFFTYTSKSTDHRFCVWAEAQVKCCFSIYMSNWKALSIEKMALPTALPPPPVTDLVLLWASLFGPSIPSPSPMCQSLGSHCVNCYSFKKASKSHRANCSSVLTFFKTVLSTLSPFHFQVNFRLSFSSSTKSPVAIALNL